MTKSFIIVAVMLTSVLAISQEKKAKFHQKADSIIRAEFPRTSIFNVDYGHSFSRDFESKLLGENFQKGKLSNQKALNISTNIPFYRYKKWTFTASANYAFNEFEFNDLSTVSTTSSFQQNDISKFHNFSTSISTTLFSSLFKKPLIYNASLIVDGNNEGFERIKGLIGASLILKRTARTTIEYAIYRTGNCLYRLLCFVFD